VSYTLAFALQLRKKHGKTSVRVEKTSVRVEENLSQDSDTNNNTDDQAPDVMIRDDTANHSEEVDSR
jgi:hypothetical protein